MSIGLIYNKFLSQNISGYAILTIRHFQRKVLHPMSEIKIIPTTGRNNCGGRCIIYAHVRDGVIEKLSTETSGTPVIRFLYAPAPRG